MKGNKFVDKDNESYKIQLLRGLGIVAVVLIHNTPIGIVQIWVRPFLNYSVGLFLFLSGFLSDAVHWHPMKRIIKVVVPYLIWSAVYVVINNYRNLKDIPYIYIYMILSAKSAAVMYYVFVYCELTILIPIIDRLSKSKYKWLGFVVSPIEIVFVSLIPLILGFENNKLFSTISNLSCLRWFMYFYLGYLIGNGRIKIQISFQKIIFMWVVAMVLQVLEGYWYFSLGARDCGTQTKLTAILSGVFYMLLAYKYIVSKYISTSKILKNLGDRSFGIFFSHEAVMSILSKVPCYLMLPYPFNAIIVIAVSTVCVIIGGRFLGKYAKYFAL